VWGEGSQLTLAAAAGVRNGRLIFALFDVLDQGHRDIVGDVAKVSTATSIA
jgi:hypothetical protein